MIKVVFGDLVDVRNDFLYNMKVSTDIFFLSIGKHRHLSTHKTTT